jgi:hypothetical protein
MIFELNHENITRALQEYMDRRNVLNGKDFTFQMKTSRKGLKTSRAIITIGEPQQFIEVVQPVVEPPVQAALPLVVEEEVTQEVAPAFPNPPATEAMAAEGEAVKATPFKKLFA